MMDLNVKSPLVKYRQNQKTSADIFTHGILKKYLGATQGQCYNGVRVIKDHVIMESALLRTTLKWSRSVLYKKFNGRNIKMDHTFSIPLDAVYKWFGLGSTKVFQ